MPLDLRVGWLSLFFSSFPFWFCHILPMLSFAYQNLGLGPALLPQFIETLDTGVMTVLVLPQSTP